MIWKYCIAWFGMMILAVVNGGIRDYVYKASLGTLTAHQVSTATLMLLIAGYLWGLVTLFPFASVRQAWMVGIVWFVMTELFEFGMGIATGKPWSELLYAYNILAGQLWVLIPLWVLIAPYLFYHFVQTK